jgi:acyl carrier protein
MVAIRRLYTEGTRTFVECGALDTLARLTKKILPTEDVDILVSLDLKKDETNSLETVLRELELGGYVTANSAVQHLAYIVLPGVEQENFRAFWMVMGKNILARIKQDYEIFAQDIVPSTSTRKELATTQDETLVKHAVVEAEQSRTTVSNRPIQPETMTLVATQSRDQLFREISALYAETLEYPIEVFSEEVQLEAELGIDSVKQTELLTRVSERYQLPPRPTNFRLSNYDTMGKVVDFVYSMQKQGERTAISRVGIS